jgi:hypothetical protein
MKNYLKSFGAGLALLAAAGVATAAETVKVLHDLSHGQVSLTKYKDMAAITDRLKLDFVESTAALTPETLRGVKLLYLRPPKRAYADEEKRAVVGFVKGGGSLLLVMDEENRPGVVKAGANDLIEPFGLKLTADLPYLHNCGGLAKAGMINKADREIPYSGGRAVEGGTPFAYMLDKDGKPAEAFAASTTLANGAKIVVMAEAMASLLELAKPEGVRLTGVPRNFEATTYWGKDSVIFMEEVLAWLVAK